MDFYQQAILGIVQGIFEWIPVSSEGVLLLISSNFFHNSNIELFIRQALILHLGTFFAALVYFRKDIKELVKCLFHYRKSDTETKRMFNFLFIATLISGILGLAILNLFELANIKEIPFTSTYVNIFIGFLLIVTGTLQVKASSAGYRGILHLNNTDGIFLGFMQGFAALPGLSRSGLTVSGLLFRNFNETTALRLSFIMSLPIVLAGNIFLNLSDIVFVKEMFYAMIFSFIFGLLTIHALMGFSKKVKFGFFVIVFGILMILAGIVGFF